MVGRWRHCLPLPCCSVSFDLLVFVLKGEGTKHEDVHIKDGRPLVTARDRVVDIVRILSSTDDMSPHHADLVPSLNVNDLAGYWGLEGVLARETAIVDVLNGVVACGHANASALAEILAVHSHALRDAVGG